MLILTKFLNKESIFLTDTVKLIINKNRISNIK